MSAVAQPVTSPRVSGGAPRAAGGSPRVSPRVSPLTEFATAARVLARAAVGMGLRAPGFRTPPRVLGAARTVRRTAAGAVVSVAILGRPFMAVLADMIEGVVVVNGLAARDAELARTALWRAASAHFIVEPSADESVA